MRRLFFVAGLLMLSMKGMAQPLSPSLQLPDSIVQADPELVDLDNDGLLDIFLVMKSKSNKSYVGIIQGETSRALVVRYRKWKKHFPLFHRRHIL